MSRLFLVILSAALLAIFSLASSNAGLQGEPSMIAELASLDLIRVPFALLTGALVVQGWRGATGGAAQA